MEDGEWLGTLLGRDIFKVMLIILIAANGTPPPSASWQANKYPSRAVVHFYFFFVVVRGPALAIE
jgi:hypothetical protein